MPRTVVLNYARLTGPFVVMYNTITASGTMSASYTVGSYLLGAPSPYLDDPSAIVQSSAQIAIGASDTLASKITALCLVILAQEGLTFGVDYVFDSQDRTLCGLYNNQRAAVPAPGAATRITLLVSHMVAASVPYTDGTCAVTLI